MDLTGKVCENSGLSKQYNLRILSLIASATEIICALGYREQMVGRSHECDYPEDVKLLPQASIPKFNIHTNSKKIDEQVKSLVKEADAMDALGVYEVLPEVLRALQPTHIITQTQCEVCAVSSKDVHKAVSQLTDCDVCIVSLHSNSLADVWHDIMTVASELGDTPSGIRLVASLQTRAADIASKARPLKSTPSVACIEWVDPLMAAGNWMPELIRMAGGHAVFSAPGQHSPWLEYQDILKADPDIIFICPCGFDMVRTMEDIPVLKSRPKWASLKAVKTGRVYIADGNQYFNRPGPRLIESLEILAELMHPDIFSFGHEGTGWTALESDL